MSSSISKKNKGRQKVEMKKMTNESNLQVTFSKRRTGLFKKASELCTLTGAEVALIIFSPGDKASSFGHPDFDTVVERYLTGAPPPQITSTMQTLETLSINARVRELNGELDELMNQLEAEKKRAEELKKQRKEIEAKYPWAAPNEDLTRPELEKKKAYLEELKMNLTRQIDQGLLIQSASNPAQFYAGSSSSDPLPSPVQAAPPQIFLPSEMLPASATNESDAESEDF